MRRIGPCLALLPIACGSPPPAESPRVDAEQLQPEWEPDGQRDATSTVLAQPHASEPPSDRRWETVRIEAPAQRDPVDRVLGARGRRIRKLSLHDAPVDDTLRMFATMGQFNLVLSEGIGARQVTLELRDVSLASAFRAVLAAARLEARVLPEGIVHVQAPR